MYLVERGLGIAFTYADPATREVVASISYEFNVPSTFAMMYSSNRAVPRLLIRFEAVLRKILLCYCDEMRGKGFGSEKLIHTQLA